MIICDTGPLVAALNAKDADHHRCLQLLESHPGPLLVPAPVITEVCWLLESRAGSAAEATFLASLVEDDLTVVDLEPPDFQRMADLVRRYTDLPLGAVDASVVAVAERVQCTVVATLDRRHFHVVRPRHVDGFILLPG
ncbi:type II toxin-antitoxin system VapC family toxin [Frankia sp. EI5c]|uniref:type II toxin-antitoxin system VapC family toxin n=1 Tax=Frankia sp. EI5c TaxID=683316 RepID=UPI0008243490|nr:PIN domain-containing protein [Frankia sp. EI5c]